MKQDLVIVGGGSTYTPPMLYTLCKHQDEFPIKRLVLYDTNPKMLEHMRFIGETIIKDLYPELEEFIVTTDSEVAFEKVDFAFMQIRSGGFEMREFDEKIPLSNGCVGQETCGAGGFAYGLRSIPDIIDIVKKIREKNPEAWIINYSNPAALVAEATRRYFKDDKKLLNLCDMPIAMMDGFAKALGTKRQSLSPRYFGLNHFGWFTHLYDESGIDQLPKVKDMLKDGSMIPEELKNDEGWVNTFNQLSTMVNDLEGDVPNTYLQYYLYPEKMVEKEDPHYTRANYVMDNRLKEVIDLRCDMEAKGTIEGTKIDGGVHGKYIIELATSILNNKGTIFLAILENNGIISNIGDDIMVEVPCMVNSYGLEPLAVGKIPLFQKALIENQSAYEKLTVDYIMTGNEDYAIKALTLNRTVVDVPKAQKIFKELKKVNREYWRI